MKLGVVFPQTEIGADPSLIKDFAQTAESIGYDHMLCYDHVLGADPADRPDGWPAVFTHQASFHEPLTLFAFLAGQTRTMEFVTGVMVLPQRQTVLVAKQAAEIDILSGGRLRLGVAIGWNTVEYESLGQSFSNRGRRIEEQIQLLRLLWSRELVDFKGTWHRIDRAGLNPQSIQRPIPIWMGGTANAAVNRVARIGDGWFPHFREEDDPSAIIADFHSRVTAAGRDADQVGMQIRLRMGAEDPDRWCREVAQWGRLGATHLAVNTMASGVETPRGHLKAIERFWSTIHS